MRIVIGVEYNGTEFHGWQFQDNLVTVQGCLESALTDIAAEPIRVICAGRTDAGVHAMGQVVHFDTLAVRSLRAWAIGVNTRLPSSISVQWAVETDETFHARYSAIARRYRYIIHNSSIRPAVLASRVTWYHYPLDVDLMCEAAEHLVGEHDFSSFRSSACQSISPVRNIHFINIIRDHSRVIIEVQANAFLHHMVRNIVGVLMRIGAGFHKPDWVLDVLHVRDRRQAADTASSAGLYLEKVIYPDEYVFPEQAPFFL